MTRTRICWANTSRFDDSDFVILGIPNETGSHSRRKGTSRAPDRIRMVSKIMDSYSHRGTTSLAVPANGNITAKVYDYGNVRKNKVNQIISKITRKSKIPVTIGGDHSNTAQIIKAVAEAHKPISLVYFDAHPDFVSSRGKYYGSVVFDCLPYIDTKSSIYVGIRSPEQEELDNITEFGLEVVTPTDFVEKGIKQVAKKILATIRKNTYVSFDMDCIDPAFAPGVSVPVPFGISSREALHLVRKISQKGIVGFDIMEVNPPFDLNDATSHLASRLIGEMISASRYN